MEISQLMASAARKARVNEAMCISMVPRVINFSNKVGIDRVVVIS